jgi:dTDP-4-amino-4,6-dideoxygalactose transaminase
MKFTNKDLIHIDLVPNFEDDDYEIIKKLEARYGINQEIEKAKNGVLEILKFYFPQGEIFFFNSARAALSFLLMQTNLDRNNLPGYQPDMSPGLEPDISGKHPGNLSGIHPGKSRESLRESMPEIITQAFSCLVVPNAIKFAGYKPIYVDIDETYNLDIEDLKRKINERTKAIIIQNTFGIPAKIDEILEIAHQNNILVIENLTHSLGAKYKEKYLGNFGDFALLSFNRNKVISSIIGGALVINNKNFFEKIKQNYESLPELTQKEIQKIIFTGKVLYQAKKNYNFLTKLYLKFLRKIGKTSEMISSIEKQGKKPKNYLFKFPEILFPLLLNQFKKLEKFNKKRKEIAKIYITWIDADKRNLPGFSPDTMPGYKPDKSGNYPGNSSGRHLGKNIESLRESVSEPIFLRFPILVENKNFVLEKFKKENIYLGDWYRCVLDPCSNLKIFDYQIGSCPKAEKITKKIINLPTLIQKTEAAYIIKNLN